MVSKLTDIAICNAKPRNKKFKISAGQGLVPLIMPNGSRHWRLRYRFAGKEKECQSADPIRICH